MELGWFETAESDFAGLSFQPDCLAWTELEI